MKVLSNCELIQESLIDYINRRLKQSENSNIAVHLSECKKCRTEAAFLIMIQRKCSVKTKDVPLEIQNSAFTKVPGKESSYRRKNYLDPVFDSFQLIGQTLRFVKQII